MKLALTAFTRRGVTLALRLRDLLGEGEVWTLVQFAREGVRVYASLSDWTAERFAQNYGLVYVGAVGIAVRAIAPCVRDKRTDPPVLAVDEGGRWVVPLLSGHVGGANALARRAAALLGAEAVLTTATDVRGLFAVDQWAAEHGMTIPDPAAAKRVSAALLEGRTVGFVSELPHGPLPAQVAEGESVPGFAVSCRGGDCFPPGMLVLHPKLLSVGVGCKRGTSVQRLEAAVRGALLDAHLALESMEALASIDRKSDEPGLLALAERWGVPCRFYTADELRAVPGAFTASAFVQSVTGVDNVCERSAVRSAEGGTLLVRRRAGDGVTVAVARKVCFYSFCDEEG